MRPAIRARNVWTHVRIIHTVKIAQNNASATRWIRSVIRSMGSVFVWAAGRVRRAMPDHVRRIFTVNCARLHASVYRIIRNCAIRWTDDAIVKPAGVVRFVIEIARIWRMARIVHQRVIAIMVLAARRSMANVCVSPDTGANNVRSVAKKAIMGIVSRNVAVCMASVIQRPANATARMVGRDIIVIEYANMAHLEKIVKWGVIAWIRRHAIQSRAIVAVMQVILARSVKRNATMELLDLNVRRNAIVMWIIRNSATTLMVRARARHHGQVNNFLVYR